MTSKRFIKLQLLIVIMMTFALVCNTFSWSNRPAVKGGNFMGVTQGADSGHDDRRYWTAFCLDTLANDYYINGNSCSGETYVGTMGNDGKVTYDTTVDAITKLGSQDVTKGTVLYFRTDITNGAAVDTNTSLFIDVKYSTDLEGKYFVCATNPTLDRLTYTAETTASGSSTVRWIPVVAQYEIPSEGTAYIEWHVEFEGSGTFEITNIVLTNN